MTDENEVFKKAESRIGDLVQTDINQKDNIDVSVSFMEDGKFRMFTVRFYKETFNEKILWSYPKIIERS